MSSLGDKSVIQWKQWEVNPDSKHLQCQYKESCVGEVIDSIRKEWKSIVKHVHMKRIQAQCFEDDKSNDNSRVLRVDFAMNYSCEYQNEVQSALWGRASVTYLRQRCCIKEIVTHI